MRKMSVPINGGRCWLTIVYSLTSNIVWMIRLHIIRMIDRSLLYSRRWQRANMLILLKDSSGICVVGWLLRQRKALEERRLP